MKASGCIISMNEEHYIERAIRSLQKIDIIDEIIVVDGGSTDNTVAVCERLGCKVVFNKWEHDFSLQRNFAMSLCKNDWVIWLDGDEWYSEKTITAISQLLPAFPDKYGLIRTNEISEVHTDALDATPFNPLDINKYVKGYKTPARGCTKDGDIVFFINGLPIYLVYSTRIVNRTKGKWVNKIHEGFLLSDSYVEYILPYEYVVHHQKSTIKQHLSNAKYYQIDHPEKFLYNIKHDDFINNTSQHSVKVLDEIFFKLITEVKPCNHFIEAGAFQGDTSRLVQLVLPNANVTAFEANPYNYEKFKLLFENSQVNYVNIAVSDKNDIVTFKVQKNYMGTEVDPIRGNNSMLARTEIGMEYEDVLVPSTTLDSYLANKLIPGESVALWIDLEGVAYQALEGAIKIFPYVDVIKVEVEQHQFWKNQKLDTDIRKLLSLYGFFPLLRDYEYSNQYNILFCKQTVKDSEAFRKLMQQYLK